MGALRSRVQERRLRRRAAHANGMTYTPVDGRRTLRFGLVPIPTQQWLDAHAADVQAYADRMVSGDLEIYGAAMWRSWHTDARSGYTWPADTWYRDCVLARPDSARPRGIDIRIPHELGRCHHWPALALAAILFPDRRTAYLATFEADVMSFYTSNPPQYGPQWTIPMGVGIRAANLAVACDWLATHGLLPGQLGQIAAAMLVDHATHIAATIEWAGGMRTSHYLGNMLGLLAAGTYLEHDTQAAAWRADAAAALTREWDVQFLPDGMSFEGSTGYHRHIVDIMVLAAMFMRSHRPLPPPWPTQLQRCLQALHDLLVRGTVRPAIGDDDDGMAVKLLSYDPDVSWTFDAASILGVPVDPAMPACRDFPDFGVYLRHHGRCRTSLRCGPIGQWGKGGHAHNDQLSITFAVDGHDVVVDPGVVCYGADPDRRNRDRSTRAHATLAPVGLEQNAWPEGPAGLFWMLGDRAQARIVEASTQTITAEHRGFGTVCRRQLSYASDALRVVDTWPDMPTHPADIVIPCAANVRVELHADHALLSGGFGTCILEWQHAHARMEPTVLSQGYAQSVDSTMVLLRATEPTVAWSIRVVP